jgi:hypothetical protein
MSEFCVFKKQLARLFILIAGMWNNDCRAVGLKKVFGLGCLFISWGQLSHRSLILTSNKNSALKEK